MVTSVQRRRRWTSGQKPEIVKQTNEQGSAVFLLPANTNWLQPSCFSSAKLIWKVLLSQSVPMKPLSRPLYFKRPSAMWLILIQSGKPMQNGYIESFNGKLCNKCLNEQLFDPRLVHSRGHFTCARASVAVGGLVIPHFCHLETTLPVRTIGALK